MLNKQIFVMIISCSLIACAGASTDENGSAEDDSGQRRDCIFRSSIRGYKVLDDSNLIVDAGGRRTYHVVLVRRAHGLVSSRGIGFESPTGRVCAGFGEVHISGFNDSDKVRIDRIQALSPEEHEDLLIRYGKKKPETEQMPAPQEVKGADIEELDTAANGN